MTDQKMDFQVSKIPITLFGSGKTKLISEVVLSFHSSVVLISGENTLKRSSSISSVLEEVKTQSVEYHHYTIHGEPSPDAINQIVMDIPAGQPVVVIAVGGGSALDAGKAVSAMLPLKDDITQYLEGIGEKKHPGSKVPFIAVPTTSGTGSETSSNAVISSVGANGFKKSLRHPNFVPDYVILDPDLVLHCPSDITAYSGMDAVTQLTEAYVSTRSNVFSDSLIVGAIKNIDKSLIEAVKNGTNPEARQAMMYAAYVSGIAINNAGLGLVHGFASELGACFPIPHGLVCARLTAPVHNLNIQKAIKERNNEVLLKYAMLNKAMSGQLSGTIHTQALDLSRKLEEITTVLNLPGLSTFGLTSKDIPGIASRSGLKNNPMEVTQREKEEILENCL